MALCTQLDGGQGKGLSRELIFEELLEWIGANL